MICLDADVYVKGSPALFRKLGITKTIPPATWVKLPATGGLNSLTKLAAETARILTTRGKVTKGGTTAVEGEPALELKTEGQLYKGRLYIKTTGEPYPLKVEKHGRETATYTFTKWNATTAPTRPTKTISAGARR